MDKPAYQNFIDGASIEATDGGTYDLVDSVTGQAHATATRSEPEDVEQALRATQSAFDRWSTTTPSHPGTTR